MNFQDILNVLMTVSTIILGGLSIYLKTSKKAQEKSMEIAEVVGAITANAVIYIAQAEDKYKDATKMGGVKFNETVDKLYKIVPTPLQTIITKEMIGNIVQSTFDDIEKYVQIRLDELADKTEIKKEV